MIRTGKEVADEMDLAPAVEFNPDNFPVGTFGVAGGGSALRVEKWISGLVGSDDDLEPTLVAECSVFPAGWEDDDVKLTNGVFNRTPISRRVVPSELKDPDGMAWRLDVKNEPDVPEVKEVDISSLVPTEEPAPVWDPEDTGEIGPVGGEPMTLEDLKKLGIEDQVPIPPTEEVEPETKWTGPHKSGRGVGGKLYQLLHTEPSMHLTMDLLTAKARVAGIIKKDEGEYQIRELVKGLDKAGYWIEVTDVGPDAIVHIGPYTPVKSEEYLFQHPATLADYMGQLRSEIKGIMNKHGFTRWSLSYYSSGVSGHVDSHDEVINYE